MGTADSLAAGTGEGWQEQPYPKQSTTTHLNTMHVVLPVPDRPSSSSDAGGCGTSSTMRCSAGEILGGSEGAGGCASID